MEDSTVNLTPPPVPPASPRFSVGRLLNVFAAPGEVFDEINGAPHQVANWLVPLLLSCLVAPAYILIAFSQPAIQQQMRDQQEQAIDKQVAAGKMPKEAGDQAKAFLDRYGMVAVKVTGSVGAVAAGVGVLFLTGLGLWLVGGKVLKGAFPFMKAVEVAGLASMITVLGTAVTIFLVVLKGSLLATPGPALLVAELDPTNKLHLVLSVLSLFELWYVAVLSVGLSKISGASFARSAAWVFGLWLVLRALLMLPAFLSAATK